MTDSFSYIGGSPVAPGEPEPGGYFGPYRGIVTNTTDPASQNRLKAVVPQLFGNTSTECDWALPCQPAGYTATPNPGSGVWIMFEGGDINYPVYMGMWQEQASLAPWDPAGAAGIAAAAAEAAAISASETYTTTQLAAYNPLLGNPAGRMYNTGDTGILNNNSAQIINMTMDYLVGGVNFSGTNNTLTVPSSGKWRVTGGIGSMNGAGNGLLTGTVGGWVQNEHGATLVEHRGYINSNYPAFTFTDVPALAAGDSLSLYGVQGTGGNAFVDPANGLELVSFLSVTLESQ